MILVLTFPPSTACSSGECLSLASDRSFSGFVGFWSATGRSEHIQYRLKINASKLFQTIVFPVESKIAKEEFAPKGGEIPFIAARCAYNLFDLLTILLTSESH